MNLVSLLGKIPNVTLLGFYLFILALIGVYKNGVSLVLPILISVLTTSLIDLLFMYVKEKKLSVPRTSVITGFFVGGILSPGQNLIIYFVASVVAILSKKIIRINKKNIFNPAAFGLIFVAILMGAQLNWWIYSSLYLVIAMGLFLAYRMKRMHLMLSFFVSFELPMVIYLIINDLNFGHLMLINFLFMFFMLIEPKTAPFSQRSRIVYGAIVGITSFILFHYFVKYDPFLLALILGNILSPFISRILR